MSRPISTLPESPKLDVESIRKSFPVLSRTIGGQPIVYLDSAATYLTPQVVIDSVTDSYRSLAGSVGRGVHLMVEESSERYAAARQTIADFIRAESDEVIFVRNATEAINLVAAGLPSDAIIVGSVGEHHSNLLPWRTRHQLTQVAIDDSGSVDLDSLELAVKDKQPSLIAISTIGNAIGAINDVNEIVKIARRYGADVLLDASQSAAHHCIDVGQLDCDYLCFSGHKLGGPSGIGVLYGKREKLERLAPLLVGGGAVEDVSETDFQFSEIPHRFESGTPAVEAAIGLAAVCDFLESIGLDAIQAHENKLTERLIEELSSVPRVNLVGPCDASRRGPIVTFHVDGLEAHGAARMLSSRRNICVRSGFHCAQPAHISNGWRPTLRASFGVYNTEQEVETLTESLRSITENLF
tara:strand:+ start:78330 stop:79562 length:1233 start_codon:yes stop_codon:yes gene_type:complete